MREWVIVCGVLCGCTTNADLLEPQISDTRARWLLQDSIAVANHVCVVDEGRGVRCSDNGRVTGLENVVAIRMGASHGCAVVEDRRVLCWGDNALAQLGRGFDGDEQLGAAEVLDLVDVVELSVGADTSCALDTSGDVYCWGRRLSGNLTSTLRPERVPLDERAIDVGVGWASACALGESGAVFCWGRNTHGVVGPPERQDVDTPVRVGEGFVAPIERLYVGPISACADDVEGTLYCWGTNGSFGRDDPSWSIAVMDTPAHETVDVGYSMICALGEAPHCFGNNIYDLSGAGREGLIAAQERFVPPAYTDADAVAVGHVAICGSFGGKVRCSGYVENFDLGKLP